MAKREWEADPCTVCLNSPMMVPIFQCTNGHILCTTCESKVQHCPTCKDKLPKRKKIRNLAVEHWQPTLVKCRNEGCQTEHINLEDMELHVEKDCAYQKRPYCKILGVDSSCKLEFAACQADDIASHLEHAHGNMCKSMQAHTKFYKLGTTGSFRHFVHKRRLFVLKMENVQQGLIKQDGCGASGSSANNLQLSNRKIIPLVVAPPHESKLYRIVFKLWFFDNNLQMDFKMMKKCTSSRNVTSVGPAIPLLGYDMNVPHQAIVDCGNSSLRVFYSVSF